jgi:hypothetical protein
MKLRHLTLALAIALSTATSPLIAAEKGDKVVWTDTADPTIPADFRLQGEYAGDKFGAQVIALGSGNFQAVLLPGGLPGAGWDGKQKILLDGKRTGDNVTFTAAVGTKKYLAQKPEEFSATSKNPPEGHKPASGTISYDSFSGQIEGGPSFSLKKTLRVSPSMGAKPPADALVLFDGTGKAEWKGGRLDDKTKLLNTDGADIITTKKFSNYTMHIEFLLPYRPEGRGQGRGNSGFYQVDHYEVQILDSFGLDGKNNECGGVYTKAEPKLNMCLPPLVWQTYDVEFTNAVADAAGKKTQNARMTLKHNGVVIHDNLEITGKTGGSRNEPEGTPGPIKLQGHGNPLQFRNLWIVEKK